MPIDIDILLFGIAVLSVSYSIICSFLQERKGKKLLRWVKMQYPEMWKSIPWALRYIVTSDIGLRRIQRAQQIDNAFFNEEYVAIKKYNKHIWLSLFCSGALLLLISL
jgi:hypothetical protein